MMPRWLAGIVCCLAVSVAWGGPPPLVPRIESVVPLARQPLEDDTALIWHDDFNGPEKRYGESEGPVDRSTSVGGDGGSMLCLYEPGRTGTGNRKVFFGDSPTGRPVRRGERFDDVYWRIYVRHEPGWTGGGPAKLSRATSLVSGRWNQAMIAHVWSQGEALTLDPATGVRNGVVVTTRYNDFPQLRWLGNRPGSTFKLHATEESGWWVCVEARAKLNTPGEKDGLMQLWIDGRLEAERTGLDWRGTYDGYGINAVFLEAYWNEGPPVVERRWYDEFVIATEPIGPLVVPRTPELILTPYYGSASSATAEVEIALVEDKLPVWRGTTTGPRVTVDAAAGEFVGTLAGKDRLESGSDYVGRVRYRGSDGTATEWSPWHQMFRTEERDN